MITYRIQFYCTVTNEWIVLEDDLGFVMETFSLGAAQTIIRWAAKSWPHHTKWLVVDSRGSKSEVIVTNNDCGAPFSQPNRLAHSGMGIKKD
jgi:hypothetical protein